MISHEAYYNAPGEHQHQEVTCMVSAGIHISTWSVESAYHEKLEDKEYHSFPEIKFYEKLQQVHQLMFKYPSVVYDRLASQASAIDGTTNPKMNFPETPSRWFSKRTSLRFWYELSGSSVHLILNSAIQQFILISMTTCIGLLCTKAFLEKRQIKLSLNSWLDTTGLRFLPHHILGLSDILPGIYYGVLLASTCFENMTSQLPSACRRLISYGLVGLALFRTLQYSHLIYGDEQWHRSQCEASGLEIQCIHFPLYPNELTELAQNSGQTPNATALTLYFGLLGKIESFRYEQGQEDRADESWALVKQSAYMKEAARLTGSYRYHRVEPTPAISLEDSIEWAKNVHADALLREKELAQERKKKRALKKKKRQAKKKNHGQRSRAE
ncbi:hypothetical protein G6F56_010446 [Rhizopus delemar]|nr:hypothetical protein G6F56_010446 [Rhizopus delemar]